MPSPVPGTPQLHVQAGRATITLNRPDQHNRLQVEDLLVLQRHFATVQADPSVRLLVLAASGKSFCSGFHLGDFGQSPEAASAGPQLFEQTVEALAALPLPTLCRLQGSVYGGATDLALACDFRLGVRGMLLRMPAARIGLHYYPSGLRRFVARLGLGAAKRLFLLAQDVPDHDLLAMGYLDQLAADLPALDAQLQALADALLANAPLAVQGMKAALDEIARGDAHLATLREREARCAASADLQEGLAALAQKRPAHFQGR
ncbi:MAG: 3-hydroxybutyryl-CoA dehydratase [Burkholderiales bacterium PBB5]|nr:MAG: 3-hydroxybutyryl-CoA dehydratase [Burkholderiales bacterium PBB5]